MTYCGAYVLREYDLSLPYGFAERLFTDVSMTLVMKNGAQEDRVVRVDVPWPMRKKKWNFTVPLTDTDLRSLMLQVRLLVVIDNVQVYGSATTFAFYKSNLGVKEEVNRVNAIKNDRGISFVEAMIVPDHYAIVEHTVVDGWHSASDVGSQLA